MNTQSRERRRGETTIKFPVEHDWDWEYTGEYFICLDCGHEFSQPPYNFEICPECGVDFWGEQEV